MKIPTPHCPVCGEKKYWEHDKHRHKCAVCKTVYPYTSSRENKEDYPICPKCSTDNRVNKYGIYKDGREKFRCLECGRIFPREYIHKRIEEKEEIDRILKSWRNTDLPDCTFAKGKNITTYTLKKLLKTYYPDEYTQAQQVYEKRDKMKRFSKRDKFRELVRERHKNEGEQK